MKIYTAHLKDRAAPVLMREGFAIAAAIFGPFWLLFHRAWIPSVLLLCANLAVGALPLSLRVPAAFALAWLTGLFGRDLVRWSLERRGFRLAHVLAARDEEGALARLLAARPDLATELLT